MPRSYLAYEVADVSAAARSLREQLQKLGHLPSHVELLNMLARAAGFRNFQHFRAAARSVDAPPEPAIDHAKVEKAARHFGAGGRLLRWPSRDSLAQLSLWVLWSRLPAGANFTELEISELIDTWHTFGDRALLRRALVDYGLVSRTVNGSRYVRIEQPQPSELRALLERIPGS